MDVFFTGFRISLALILAIGAQNAFVLKQGLLQRHVGIIVAICIVIDAILIGVGVASIGWIASEATWITDVLLYTGVAFLFFYGAKSFYAAWAATGALEAAGEVVQSWQSAVLTCLAVTLLNPHIYLDTIVVVGAVSAQFPGQGVAFWAGATLASALFFAGLGFGARFLAPFFARRGAWVALDIFVGCVMWSIAVGLLLG